MSGELIVPWDSQHEEYLQDESRSTGTAESISFPTTEAEVIEVVREVGSRGGSITVQGARTGITAGAVPSGGHVLNLQRMNAIGEVRREAEGAVLTAQPGALLQDIYPKVEAEGLFFPPDPTEASATIGGAVACNASGAMSFHYGPTRRWVRSLRLVLADGSVLAMNRGEHRAQGRTFSLTADSGRTISGQLPSYTVPSVKSAAGYYVADDMDLLDLFIGMEGTLGIVTEAELILIPPPAAVLGLTAFLPSEEAALKFVRALRERGGDAPGSVPTVAIEFFDHAALDLLRRAKAENPAFESLPPLADHFHTAVYCEFHGEAEEPVEEAMLDVLDSLVEVGGNDEDTWAGTTPRDLESLKTFRHAVPEAVNLTIADRKRETPELTKLGTDMSVPDAQLETAMAMYRADLAAAGLESVVFGHIADNHVHVNILPRDLGEYERGRALYQTWAQQVVAWGGSVSAEHGIGKLKVPFLELMYGADAVAEMRQLKTLFDPNALLNPGNLFSP